MMVFGKHPHERGEDAAKQQQKKVNQETPPRAWGRLTGGTFTDLSLGNTPTSVGKTTSVTARLQLVEKHPHERGEDTP